MKINFFLDVDTRKETKWAASCQHQTLNFIYSSGKKKKKSKNAVNCRLYPYFILEIRKVLVIDQCRMNNKAVLKLSISFW